MKPEARRCKCLHCKKLFVPDYRNRGRQKYCSAPECQQASKRARQQRWLSKPENRDHFRGAENVQRVQEWRAGPSGLLEALPTQDCPYVTRRLLGATRCRKGAYTGCVTRGLPQYVTRCLPGASASAGGAYLQVHRLYVTRRHRPFHPPPDSQGAGHSGSTFQQVHERKHVI